MQQLSQSNMLEIVKKLNIKNKEKGSLTVEAAMIFPLIMFIMFAIIYLTIIHYQNNVMIAESIRAMNRAGAYWQYSDMWVDVANKDIKHVIYDENHIPVPFDNSIPSDLIINSEMIKNRNPYRTIVDVASEGLSRLFDFEIFSSKKKKNASAYVNARIANIKFKQYKPDVGEFTNVEEVRGGGFMFFGEDLNVNVGRAYINPMQNLAKAFLPNSFLSKNRLEKRIKVSSMISNQAEFIRNIDTVYDIGMSLYKYFSSK